MLLALLLQLALLLVLLRGPACSLNVTKYNVSPAAACCTLTGTGLLAATSAPAAARSEASGANAGRQTLTAPSRVLKPAHLQKQQQQRQHQWLRRCWMVSVSFTQANSGALFTLYR
jgi:hypothetical protein